MKNSIIKQIGSGGQGMTPKQKEDLAGLLSRMAEVEAIFQGMDAADFEALKDTAEVKQGLGQLQQKVNELCFKVEYGVTPYNDVLEAYNNSNKLIICIIEDGGGRMSEPYYLNYFDKENSIFHFGSFNAGQVSWQVFTLTQAGYSNISSNPIQSRLTFDNAPTANSNNPVKSSGIKTALDAKQDALVSGTNIKTINGESILGAGNVNFAKYEDSLISSDAITCETTETVEGVSVYSSDADYYLQPNQKIVFADTVGDNTLYIINYDDISNPFIISSGKGSISWNNFTNNDVRIQLASSSNVGQTLSASRYWRGTDNVFIAEYEVTTYQQILDAYNAGKIVVCNRNNRFYGNLYIINSQIYLTTIIENNFYFVRVAVNNTWATGSLVYERTENKATDFTTLNNTKYPTTQAVADYVSAIVGNINTILDTI